MRSIQGRRPPRLALVVSLCVLAALAVAGATSARVDDERTGSASVSLLEEKPELVTFCHVAGREEDPANTVTLTLPFGAVYGQGGHFNEDGTPNAGHEQDHLGACIPPPPPSPQLSVEKTAQGTSRIQHNWAVEKQVEVLRVPDLATFGENAVLELLEGGSGTVRWLVTVTHSQIQTYSVSGTIVVSNGGGVAVTGVNVTDSIPDATIDCGGSSTGLTVPANGSIQCSYTVAPGSQVQSNTATASWGNGESASDTATIEWADPTEVGVPVQVRDSNGLGELIGLGDLIHNNNTSATMGYDETWTCANGKPSPNSGRINVASVTWDGGSDSDSASVQVGCGSTPPPPTDVCPNIDGNQATLPAGMLKDGQGNCVTPPPPPPTTPTTPPTDEFMDVQVLKDATPQVQLVNGQTDIAYTVRVRNNGPNQAHNVVVTDAAPSGVTFLAVTQQPVGGNCTLSVALLSCTLGTLGPGVERSITLSARVTQTGTYVNSATAVGDGKDTNGANNTDNASTLVTAPVTPPAMKPTVKPKPKPKQPTSKPAPEVCRILKVTPGMVRVNGKQQLILATVTQSKKPVAGVAVRFAGKGFAKVVTTNAQGVARISVKPSKAGIVLVRITSAKACNSARIGVVGAFEPPVTG